MMIFIMIIIIMYVHLRLLTFFFFSFFCALILYFRKTFPPPPFEKAAEKSRPIDVRTYAMTPASTRFLDSVGAWQPIVDAGRTSPYDSLQVHNLLLFLLLFFLRKLSITYVLIFPKNEHPLLLSIL
jgi:hypothetical protein